MTDLSNDPAAGPGREARLQMRLRSGRAPVTRLSRKVIVALGLVVALAIAAALFLALQPRRQTAGAELYGIDNRATPDGLSNLPRDYAGLPKPVPKLGPPLPGDLGRPILNAGASPATPMAPDAEKQKVAQEQEAARVSRLFATTSLKQGTSALPVAVNAPAPTGDTGTGTNDLAPQDRKLAFLNGNIDRRTVSSERVAAPASPYVLQAGAVIPAALLTGLRSDLPGQVTAQVTEDVYDSPTGRIRLIPQGARLIGQYDAQIAFGQSRALLVWNRGTLFKAAILSTLLSIGSEVGSSGSEDDLIQAIRRGGADSANQVGQRIVGRSLNVQPTITIRPGFPVRVLVTRDLVLEPYRG